MTTREPACVSLASGDVAPDSGDRFLSALDGRVARVRAGVLLASLGRITIALIGLSCIAAALARAGRPLPPALLWLAATATAVVGRAARPGRLETAREIEAALPSLGERISRAVGLVPDGGQAVGRGTEDATTRSLARELVERAAEDASAALVEAADVALPSIRTGRLWAGASAGMLLAMLAATMLEPAWREALLAAVGGERARDESGPTPGPSAVPPRRLEESAAGVLPGVVPYGLAAHRLLAPELAARFALRPGLPRADLPADERDWLDRAADLQKRVADDLLRALAEESLRPTATESFRSFAEAQAAVLAAIPPAIRDNRLATALSRTRAFLAAAEAAGLLMEPGNDSSPDMLRPLASRARPPVDAGELAAARLARLVDPQLARRIDPRLGPAARAGGPPDGVSPDTSPHAPASSGRPDASAPRDSDAQIGEASADADGQVATGSARTVTASPGAPRGAGETPTGSPAAPVGVEAWAAGRDRPAPAGVVGLAGSLPAASAAAVDRYYSILTETSILTEPETR